MPYFSKNVVFLDPSKILSNFNFFSRKQVKTGKIGNVFYKSPWIDKNALLEVVTLDETKIVVKSSLSMHNRSATLFRTVSFLI